MFKRNWKLVEIDFFYNYTFYLIVGNVSMGVKAPNALRHTNIHFIAYGMEKMIGFG